MTTNIKSKSDQQYVVEGKFDPSKTIIPKEVAIETVFGCNLSCTMCFVDQPTWRQKGVMSMEMFEQIVNELKPYASEIEKFDLFALGEPMLDKHLFERIRMVRAAGFRNLAIATNADLLDDKKQEALLESGIDTVIFSIDGIKKETHEKIRIGVDFDRVMVNCKSIIHKRDLSDYKTRFVVRFVRQESNWDEWPEYRAYWNGLLDRDKRDFVARYDEHNHGGKTGVNNKMVPVDVTPKMLRLPCHYLFNILIILADGTACLCTADFLDAQFQLGKYPEQSLLEIFNSEAYQKLRTLHHEGRRREIDLCKDCNIPYRYTTKANGWDEE